MTTKQMLAAKKMVENGVSFRDASKALEIPYNTLASWCSKNGLRSKAKRGRRKKTYTVYLRKDSSYIVEGTAERCAEVMGIKVSSFRSAITRTKNGELSKYDFYEVET